MNSFEYESKTKIRGSKDLCKKRISTNYLDDSKSDYCEESQYDSDADPEFKCSESELETKNRESKDLCKKRLLTNYLNDSESDNCEESQYDSDADPAFICSENSDENEESINESGDNTESDSEVCPSDISEFKVTFDMLTNVLNSQDVPLNDEEITSAQDMEVKTASKRKITVECSTIYGLAQKNFWSGNLDKALENCDHIMKKYPRFGDTYVLLANIYELKRNYKKAEEYKYIAAICNPKDIDKWIVTIDSTKEHFGIEKAIERAKVAVKYTRSNAVREKLIELLEEAGHVKEAMIKRLTNIESTPVSDCSSTARSIVEELIGMGEQFEALKDDKRAAKCREIIDLKYPQFLDDRQRIELLKEMVKVNRFGAVLRVAEKIKGVVINPNIPQEYLMFSKDISEEYRREVIVSVITTAVHLKISVFIQSHSFIGFIKELLNEPSLIIGLINKLFEFEYFKTAADVARYMAENSLKKLEAYKILGQCQERLGENEAALLTYDTILDTVTNRDAFVYELKANLLYRMKEKEKAIHVLLDCQDLIRDSPLTDSDELVSRSVPTPDGARLLYKLSELLKIQNRITDFVRVAWKYIFFDSRAFFATGNVELSCEDLSTVRGRIRELSNRIWLCVSKTTDEHGHCIFDSVLASGRSSDGPSCAWSIFESLFDILVSGVPVTGSNSIVHTDNSDLIELLTQWALVLHKVLIWSRQQRMRLAEIYVVSALKNRLTNHRVRLEVSGMMMFQELRFLKEEYGERNQFWNLYHMCCCVMGYSNNRYVLRAMNQTSNVFPLELINAGQMLTSNSKLSLAIHTKLYSQNLKNPQLCLQMAITLVNSSLSRNCRDTVKAMMLASSFLKHYRNLRGTCQETCYNSARFYQRIGNDNVAARYYRKCLALQPVGRNSSEQSITDLSRDAAFNLILMCKPLNKRMVFYLRQKYLTI